jgi:hypothetical protein
VRTRPAGGYELIAGERRWRAAQRAGLHEVPAVIRDVAPSQAFEMALVENLQREDLNPLEEAAGYERLIASSVTRRRSSPIRVGKERSTVANSLRLLRLPEGVRGLVAQGRLSMDTRGRCWAWSRRPRWRSWRADGRPGPLRFARSRRWSGAIARTGDGAAGAKPGGHGHDGERARSSACGCRARSARAWT